MGKKQTAGGEVAPTSVSGVPNRDVMQRMNFLWQASVYLERVGGVGAGRGLFCESGGSEGGEVKDGERVDVEMGEEERTVPEPNGKQGKREGRQTASMRDLSRIYVRTMKAIGRKTTVKMDPGVKRTLCRRCSVVLVPGVSVRIRNRPSKDHSHWAVYTCLECGTSRRIPADDAVIENAKGDGSPSSIDHETAGMDISAQAPRDQEVESKDGMGEEKSVARDITGVHGGESKKRRKRRKKKDVARMPPLFARSAGHVVFRGGEVVDSEGVYCV